MRLFSSTSKDTEVISRLDRAFRLHLTEAIKREINRSRRLKITGEELITELITLYHRYNIADLEKHQHQSTEQSESYAKVICSAAFV